MWLTGRLTPDFKTIANFRKDNGKAIRGVCRQFVVLCRELDLFSEAMVAIDGSKFKAVNNRDRNFTSAKLQRRMQEIEESIDRYLAALDTADRQEPAIAQVKTVQLKKKIAALKKQMQQLKEIEEQMNAAPDKQISLTDPDARSMKTRGTGMVGYNVQTAVDAKHHLIVAHEVTNVGVDRSQLQARWPSKRAPRWALKNSPRWPTGVTSKAKRFWPVMQAGITALVPKSFTSNNKADGLFDKSAFIYLADKDVYRCPAEQRVDQTVYVDRRRQDPANILEFGLPRLRMKAQVHQW